MRKPTLKLATWADYADIHNLRMNILRAYGYREVESLPEEVSLLAAIQIEIDDLHPPMHLRFQLKDYELNVIHEVSFEVVPERTLTDRCVIQALYSCNVTLKKHENTLFISDINSGTAIGELSLPVVTRKAKAANSLS